MKISEAMAVNLLGLFEAERIKIPPEATLRSSLQLPERSGTARGMIYTPRTNRGHADDFWSMALAAWSLRVLRDPFHMARVRAAGTNSAHHTLTRAGTASGLLTFFFELEAALAELNL